MNNCAKVCLISLLLFFIFAGLGSRYEFTIFIWLLSISGCVCFGAFLCGIYTDTATNDSVPYGSMKGKKQYKYQFAEFFISVKKAYENNETFVEDSAGNIEILKEPSYEEWRKNQLSIAATAYGSDYLGYIEFEELVERKEERYEQTKLREKQKQEENERKASQQNKPSSVYLMFNPLNNTYKIGKANDVYKRLRTFQTGTPDIQLVTYKTYASEKQAFQMESMLHSQYQDNNYKKEWFNLNEEDVEFIKQTLS
jgi:predicted GIY-YIG superfamily endonuclease